MSIFKKHYGFWTKENKKSLILGLILILLAIIIQIGLGKRSMYQSISANPAKDLLLDNLPLINTQFIIIQGVILFWIFVWIFIILNPKYLLFSLKATALFTIIRAFFINLTPLGAYPHYIPFEPKYIGFHFYNTLTFEGNFFFSGHTGFPVLLAHSHYSIDVFASPFITYGIFKIATRLFKNDYLILKQNKL